MSQPHLKPYAHYKDSGIAWLGEVPGHWDVMPVKNIANIVNGYPFDASLFNSVEGYPIIRIRDLNKLDAETFYKGEFIESASITFDDVLIGMDGDFNVGRWRGKGKALLNQRMCCVKGKTVSISRLLEYTLPIPLKLINDVTYSTTVKHLSSRQIEKIMVAFPISPLEQLSIIEFLDQETGKIDELVEEQRRLIDLLKEKRQAVISHAVTKGLNPNAPMKDSGIEWLGQIPAHWEVWKFCHFAPIVTCGVAATPEYQDDGVIFLSAQNIKRGKLTLEPGFKYISQEKHMELTRHRAPSKGDILLSRVGAKIGAACIIDVDFPFSIFVSLTHIRLNQEICLNEFYIYLTQSKYLQALNEIITAVGGGVGNLNVNDLKEYRFCLPSIKEQTAIIEHLNIENLKLEKLMAQAERAIELLQERRTALISAAVTGKIDVRQPVQELIPA